MEVQENLKYPPFNIPSIFVYCWPNLIWLNLDWRMSRKNQVVPFFKAPSFVLDILSEKFSKLSFNHPSFSVSVRMLADVIT